MWWPVGHRYSYVTSRGLKGSGDNVFPRDGTGKAIVGELRDEALGTGLVAAGRIRSSPVLDEEVQTSPNRFVRVAFPLLQFENASEDRDQLRSGRRYQCSRGRSRQDVSPCETTTPIPPGPA